MKKRTLTYYFIILSMMFGWWHTSYAQTYFKSYFIDETFDGLETFPENWSARTGGDAANIYSRNASSVVANGVITTSGSGGGNRGNDITFPSPIFNLEDADDIHTWYLDFEWKVDAAALGPRNSLGLIVSGSSSLNVGNDNSWYAASIFGIYAFGDGFLHYWNMDLNGPVDENSAALVQYNGYMGPVYHSGNNGSNFARSGYADTNASGIAESAQNVASYNASTKTNVIYANSVFYHISAKLNFKTQKVESLTITQKDDPTNTQTITDMPFLAPSLIGPDETIKAVEDRIVTDMCIISQTNSRASRAGNGDNANMITVIDNLQVYYMKESSGTADISIKYIDKDGNTIKPTRIVEGQQYGELFSLSNSDKQSFIENGFYYAYDADATLEANMDKGNGESLIPIPGEDNSLTVIFKKFQAADGTMVWTGAETPIWNELDGNFKYTTITGLGYQKGQSVEFSDADASKDVTVNQTIEMENGHMLVSTGGYDFSGSGTIKGTGNLTISAPTILGVSNQMEGGAHINTTEPVTIKKSDAATSFNVIDNAHFIMEHNAAVSTPIIGAGEGSTLTIEAVSAERLSYSFPITEVSTVNIIMRNAGARSGSGWTNSWLAKHDNAQVVNVINGVEGSPLTGLGNNQMPNVTLNLGDSIRLLREYNESDGASYSYGAINGVSTSFIETGFVSSRTMTYAVGGLGTDAVFEGGIRPYTVAGAYVRTDNTFNLNKVGTGKWTLSGHLDFAGNINAKEGTLILTGMVDTLVNTLQVDSAAVLQIGAIDVKASNTTVNKYGKLITQSTNFANDLQISGTLQGSASMFNIGLVDANLNLSVNSFGLDDYDVISSESDVTIVRSMINITVKSATEGSTIKLIDGYIDFPEGEEGTTIFVNGINITANTEDTEGAEFVWYPYSGELKSLVTKIYDAVNNPVDNKIIKSVKYFDLIGRTLNEIKENSIVIRQIIYEDNSYKVDKVFIKK